MLLALAFLTFGAAVIGAILGWTSVHFRADGNPLVDAIENLLPHMQCGQCGFPGCRGYAEALSNGAALNLCTPGGEAGARKLAELLGRDLPALPASAAPAKPARRAALIDEQRCIGCTLCLQTCPVDAIVGAAKQLHTVIGTYCTGCGLCVSPCPMECIQMKTQTEGIDDWTWASPMTITATERARVSVSASASAPSTASRA